MTPRLEGAKNASNALVRAVGGQEACVGFARYRRHQSYSEFGNVAHPDKWMPLDVIADLEAVTHSAEGAPIVTRYLAALSGHALVKLPEAVPTGAAFTAVLAQVTKEFSDVSQGLLAALADGLVSEGDVKRLRLTDESRQLIEVAVHLHAMLEAVEAEG